MQQAFDQIQANYSPNQLPNIRHLVTSELYSAFEEDAADVSNYDSKPFFKHLNAEVIDTVDENNQYIASVKIRGDIDEANQRSEPFREIWHFTKQKGSSDWLLAGIEPY